MTMLQKLKSPAIWLKEKWASRKSASTPRNPLVSIATIMVVVLLVLGFGVGWYWTSEPEVLWVNDETPDGSKVIGFSTTDTLIRVAQTLLDKPGGYMTNDVLPPSLFLDNIKNWEYGVLVQVRDLARVMRNDYSRSQSQSRENPNLAEAEPLFSFDNDSWLLPPTEREYRQGIEHLQQYRDTLVDTQDQEAQFYARADNLREWLAVVEKRLGGLSQQLSASVGQTRVNTDLAGERAAESSTASSNDIDVKTPWLEIDDRFYEARGAAWALVHFLRAAEFDFRDVLEDKNAVVSLRQIIRELEASLSPLRSPVVLNGSGFSIFANHSLVMASYLSRANAAVINLRELLDQG